MVGIDVISLHPILDVDQEVDRIKDEVLRTDLEFINVDYHEAAKYLVLEWGGIQEEQLEENTPTQEREEGRKTRD